MNTLCGIIVMATGVFQVTMALMNKTENNRSAAIFKVIPMFLGLGCIFSALVLFGVI